MEKYNYEDIVQTWYQRLRPAFMRRLAARFATLSLYDAEDIYHDAFMCVHKNLQEGRIREDTCWSGYIMTIGINLASKRMRHLGITDSIDYTDPDNGGRTAVAMKIDTALNALSESDDRLPVYHDPDAQCILGEQLRLTPEPCFSIIRDFYYADMSMEEIAGELGYKNAATVRVKKSGCMRALMERLRKALRIAGILNT